MTPVRRLYAHKIYGRAVNAFDAVAWRPPSAARFDGRPANDAEVSEPTLKEMTADMPGWGMVVAGGAIAALMGALVGGALAL
ncbi:MAG: hypothetical protein Q8R45_07100 [Brevundimonas sp.]|uniref:hypothetical protein n=1 Tax=Brevundimonas sp. TaxID=1871086 RepID=UPI0027352E27|nr:hypothetical protein [Brevundimonas sp.]MDP3656713.1 hypothetical protein [Brevundimonas sp.]MDZ4110453.1 hypothetical protein [Brevundimonas sp.]